MEEKFVLKSPKLLITILIICISIVFVGFLFNQHDTNKLDVFSSETIDIPQVSQKPDYVVYPTISNITITHEDNISLYASSGDGLSWQTAYIIENVTIYNATETSFYISNIDKFIIVRNFQIFARPDDWYEHSIAVHNCSNLSFQNGTFASLQPDLNLQYCQGLFALNSSLIFSDMCFYDGYIIHLHSVNDSIFENLLYVNPIQSMDLYSERYSFYASYSDNISLIDSIFSDVVITNPWIDWNDWEGLGFYESTNIYLQNNILSNNGIRVSWCSNVTIKEQTSQISQDLYFTVCENVDIKENCMNFRNASLTMNYCDDVVVENNIFSNSFSEDYYSSWRYLCRISISNCTFRNNYCLSTGGVFYIGHSCSGCNDIYVQIEKNVLVCLGTTVIRINLNDKTSLKLIFKRNRVSGDYLELFDDHGVIPNFYYMFTNIIKINPLLFIWMIFASVYGIWVIILITFASKIKNLEQNKEHFMEQFISPIAITFLCLIYSIRSTTYSSGSYNIAHNYGFDGDIFLFHLIQMIVILSIGFLISGIKTFKAFKSRNIESLDKLDKREIGNLSLKIFLCAILPNALFYYLMHYFVHIFAFTPLYLYFSMILIIQYIGLGKGIRDVKGKHHKMLIFALVIFIDFVFTFIMNIFMDQGTFSSIGGLIGNLIRTFYIFFYTFHFEEGFKKSS